MSAPRKRTSEPSREMAALSQMRTRAKHPVDHFISRFCVGSDGEPTLIDRRVTRLESGLLQTYRDSV